MFSRPSTRSSWGLARSSTPGGNKKGPSYHPIVDWVSAAWTDFDVDIIKRSFTHTGVTNTGETDMATLHSKLRDLLNDVETVEEEEEEEDDESDDDDDDELPDV